MVHRVVSYLELVEETQPGTFGLHSGACMGLGKRQLPDTEILTWIKISNKKIKLLIHNFWYGVPVFRKNALSESNYDAEADVGFKTTLKK